MGLDDNTTPFNMAMLYYMGLSKLWDRKDDAYLNGDVFGWYLGLKAKFRKMIFKLSPEEESEIKEMFKAIRSKLKDIAPVIKTAEQKRDFVNSEVSSDLELVDEKLIKLLNKYNMIFPNIKVLNGLDKLEERYGKPNTKP